ncbi:Fic family protein [Pedobacter sp. AW31-3R]|uniref:Fic family protein n=1 Tax=Pedobacter sp. AW31-3R TaxID=3445781 RepID=UPI003FA15261
MKVTALIEKYKSLDIDEVIDHEKFNQISIVYHSTRIEGSTLTEMETQIFLSDGLMPKGRPLLEKLMVKDYYAALQFTLNQAKKNTPITADLIRQLNSIVLKNNGGLYHTEFHSIDAATGAFRKGNITVGESYFPNFEQVEELTHQLAEELNQRMKTVATLREKLDLAYDAHFKLVSIHPFYDGNGRTSRLLMNYIQAVFNLPLTTVDSETKAVYFQALIDTRKHKNLSIFHRFMDAEYEKWLQVEISKFEEMLMPQE